MARPIFWPTADSAVRDAFGELVATVPVRIWTARAGGTQVTDLVLVAPDGTSLGAAPAGVLTSDSGGLIPAFGGPDGGPTTLWGDHGYAGARLALTADPATSGTGPGGAVTSVVAHTGAVSGAQILADASVAAALAGKASTAHAATHTISGADPVTLTQAQITGLATTLAGKADLVAGLLASAQLPPIAITVVRVVTSQAEMLALPALQGWAAIRTDTSATYLLATNSPATLADWKVILAPGQVISVAGKTGVVALTAADITSGTFDITRLPTGTTGGTVAAGNDSRFAALATAAGTAQTTATQAETDAQSAISNAATALTAAQAAKAEADSNSTALTALDGRVTILEDRIGVAGPGVTPPGAPTGITGTPGIQQAGVTFTAPASTGGSPITGYTVTASTGQTGTGTSSPILVTGLTAGIAVTFTVTATNIAGTGPASAPSAAVTILAPPVGTTAPVFVHTLGSGALTATGTSVTITTVTAATAGNSIILAVAVPGNPGAVTVADDAANVYRSDGVVANGTATTLYVFSSLLANGLPSGGHITVSFTSARTLATVQAHEISGLTNKTVDDNSVGTANSSTALTTATITTEADNDFVFTAWAMAGNGTLAGYTPGVGFTTAATSIAASGSSSRDMYSEYAVKTTAGTINPTATVSTGKNWAGIAVAYSAGFTGTTGGGAATGTYSDFASLNAAIPTALPGDVLTLAAGTFAGKLVVSDIHGTAAEPILITGPNTAVFNAGAISSGYGVQLDQCSYVTLHGFTVTNAQKGVVVDRSTNCVIENLTVHDVGEEGIHLRNESSYNTVRNNTIHDTGQFDPRYGEGLYCGTAVSNWNAATRLPAAMSGFPDHSDFNQFTGNNVSRCTGECIDIKEGTFGGVFSGNTLDGSLIAGANSADSWVDLKGESWTVADNTASTIMTDGVQSHKIGISSTFTAASGYTDGLGVHHPPVRSGDNNVVDNNVFSCSPATGFGVNFESKTSGNVVYTNNQITGAAAGASNIPEIVKP